MFINPSPGLNVKPMIIISWHNYGQKNLNIQTILSGRHTTAYELCVCLRMKTFCHTLSYADARRQHAGRWLSELSEHAVIRARTSELVPYADKFYACTKFSVYADVPPVRSEHAMHTLCERSARPRCGWRTLTERPQYVDVGGHKIFQFHDEPSTCW